jgi:DNA-binding MarR family transcriptional regulator
LFVGDIARLMKRRFDARLRVLGLSVAQAKALLHVSRQPGLRQARLADLLDIQPITLARLIDRMARDAWIERRPDPVDRRAVNLYLLERAKPILDRLNVLLAELQDLAFAGLSETQAQALLESLQVARDNLARLDTPTREAS